MRNSSPPNPSKILENNLPETLLRRVFQQIDMWRNDLINLARSNRLLYFKPTRVTTLEITDPAPKELVKILLGASDKGLRIRYTPADTDDPEFGDNLADKEIRTDAPNEIALERSLRELYRRSTQEYLDRGIWTLYLGLGQLEWIEQPNQLKGEGDTIRSPLLLVPVEIFQEGSQTHFFIRRSEEDIALNPALVVKLQHDFGMDISLPDSVEEDDIDSVFSFVEDMLPGKTDWGIIPKTVLSLFSFHKEAMYRDLQNNEELIAAHEYIQALALENDSLARFEFEPVPHDQIDIIAAPENMCAILDADASQRQAIIAARDGRSFIMDGPPGTGKSQTIANIIAELLTQEKTILFVSEKAAALEVVYKRLAETKLDDFILELHSHKATRKEVAKRLGKSILSHPSIPAKMAPDAISHLANRRKELTDYAIALNEVRQPLGQTLHKILGIISQLQSLPQAPHPKINPNTLSAELLGEMVNAAELIARAWKPVEEKDHFYWRDLIDSQFNQARRISLSQLLESAINKSKEVEEISRSIAEELLLKAPADMQAVAVLQKIEQLLSMRKIIDPAWLIIDDLGQVKDRVKNLKNNSEELTKFQTQLEGVAGQNWRALRALLKESFSKAIEEICASGNEWNPRSSVKFSELSLKIDFLKRSEKLIIDLLSWVPELKSMFTDNSESWNIERISKLAQIGILAAQPNLPEKAWIDLGQLPTLREISSRCREAVREYQSYAESLREIFLPDILDINLELLCVRFDKIYKGLRFFNKNYWKDKKTLSVYCVSGKLHKNEKSRLRSALAWQRAKERLEFVERLNGPKLGSYYWRGVKTDFKALDSALDIAEKAATLAGLDLNLEGIRNLLAHNGSRYPRLHVLAGEIVSRLEKWKATANKESIDALSSVSLEKGKEIAGHLARVYESLAGCLKEANNVLGLDTDLDTLKVFLDLRTKIASLESWFMESFQEDRNILGDVYQGPETDWIDLGSSIDWANEVRNLFKGPISKEVADRLLLVAPRSKELELFVQVWEEKRDLIGDLFERDKRAEIINILGGEIENNQLFLDGLSKTIDDIGIWDDFKRAKQGLKDLGFENPTAFCIERNIKKEFVPGVIKRSILEVWVDNMLYSDKRFTYVSAVDRDSFVEEFCQLDKELVKRAAAGVIEICNGIRPKSMAGAAGIIVREAEKQRKHMPIRTLIERTGPVVRTIKPCFMMSPLSVSQFLPPTIKFDFVIFDEASQVKPADAINCIYRGSQLIVAGDQKQLPPTTFFERTTESDDDTYDEETPDQFQSILDKCKATGTFSSIPLRWHYRSQHEDLIAFSNYSFYEHRLITFPCAQIEATDLGIELVHVSNGIYRRGTSRDNYEEAKKVVDRVRYHCDYHPECSIGVVAFSEAQAFLIETLIQQESMKSPKLRIKMTDDRLNGLFIKNLETVQGDERDIILFSIGYGRDEFGKFTLNFGPINKPEGWRRLNVAITRARRRIEVVTSILPKDFPAEVANPSVSYLKQYLEYAERRENRLSVLAMRMAGTEANFESPFEEEVARVIKNWGYEVVPQVGCAEYRIDLGVRHPLNSTKYVLGIECDGAMYHSSRVARDRDRLRHEVLQGLGWTLHRIWGPSWYRHRTQQEARLKEALERAIVRANSTKGETDPDPEGINEEKEGPGRNSQDNTTCIVDLNKRPDWVVLYSAIKPGMTIHPNIEIHDLAANSELDRIIFKAIDAEAPVHYGRIVRIIKEAWGLARAGTRVNEAIKKSLTRLKNQGVRSERYFYGFGNPIDRVRIPDPENPDTDRTVDEVPIEEIVLAMKNTVIDTKAIDKDELLTIVARLFGWERCGDFISHSIRKVLKKLLNDAVLKEEADYITIASDELR